MNGPEITLEVAPELRLFVPHERRGGPTRLTTDGASTLGHVIESLGVPLTEAGTLLVNGEPVPRSHVPGPGEHIDVRGIERPQQLPGASSSTSISAHWPAG